MPSDREGDFITMHKESYPRVYAFVRRRINDPETSQEIAADVFRIAWQKWEIEDQSVAWLLSVARHLVGNAYRSRDRRRELELQLARNALGAPVPDDSAGNLVDELLPLLKSAQQEILRLAYWDGLSSEEMATVLGISANSARVRLHRAREAFRRAAAKSGSALGPVQELEA
ncbi:MAG: sigma-70 family RNA polymerase sigma factor [Renibacterium sp.]|nr:sigma-70 family RNA polymerase sigma factor [Renibacterium sp.]